MRTDRSSSHAGGQSAYQWALIIIPPATERAADLKPRKSWQRLRTFMPLEVSLHHGLEKMSEHPAKRKSSPGPARLPAGCARRSPRVAVDDAGRHVARGGRGTGCRVSANTSVTWYRRGPICLRPVSERSGAHYGQFAAGPLARQACRCKPVIAIRATIARRAAGGPVHQSAISHRPLEEEFRVLKAHPVR
jgi:hypothetical protein